MGTPLNTTTTTATPNFDNLLLQSLMSRLQLRHQNPQPSPHRPNISQSLEDLLLDTSNFSDFSDDEEEEPYFTDSYGDHKTQLSKQESNLEKELVKIILSGNTESLKPNSGQAVGIGEHHVCVGYHEEEGSEYRVWEWHGHIMLFDDDSGYTPEYIYGNYFERRFNFMDNKVIVHDDDSESKNENLGGLKDLIQCGDDSTAPRILHQGRNAGSPRALKGSSGN